MMNLKIVWAFTVVLSMTSSTALAYIEFNNGQIHNIDYQINNLVLIDWLSPGMQTTVNLLDGGMIKWPHELQAYEESNVNIRGGTIEYNLSANDASRINMSGGSIGGNLDVMGRAEAEILGGLIGGHVWAWDSSRIRVTGGSIQKDLWARGSSQVEVFGGSIEGSLHALDRTKVEISGGLIGGHVWADSSSQVDISGGLIGHEVEVYGNSQVDILGGSIGGRLVSSDLAVLTIHGWDFALDGEPVGYCELTSIYGLGLPYEYPRHLTGTLFSGEPIDNDFYILGGAKIILIPEPASILLMGFGVLAILRNRFVARCSRSAEN